MDAGFYRGTSTDQDIRFTDKERKLLKQMRFEQVLDIKVEGIPFFYVVKRTLSSIGRYAEGQLEYHQTMDHSQTE
ncbi:PWI domain-containing protein [Meloidogyne graminicola]|uniref:PWI domain-containing protein n=1 Tax=Meloidogyne graminicola TaxID=189291 RepID=A0A8S9ZSP1_9BILA|nr:PWI domain-containing protein [Meloidogyne graminicola]